ncbi:MAG: hypothetical protein ACTSRA_15270 [Promethearchaeota archaeon]
MSFNLSYVSKRLFYTSVIILFIFIVFIWIIEWREYLTPEIRGILWYVIAFNILIAGVFWLVYRATKTKKDMAVESKKRKVEFSRPGEEPRIGRTYRWGED